MFLTEARFREKMTSWGQRTVLLFLAVLFHGLEQMDGAEEKGEGQLPMQGKNCIGEIKRIKSVHMQSSIKEKVSFYLTAAGYLLFNLRPAADLTLTVHHTLKQILQTAPYVAGFTWFIVAMLGSMSEGEKVPWERRFRLFFTIGIFAGLVHAIIEYTGKGVGQ
jgi:hypothetical protein